MPGINAAIIILPGLNIYPTMDYVLPWKAFIKNIVMCLYQTAMVYHWQILVQTSPLLNPASRYYPWKRESLWRLNFCAKAHQEILWNFDLHIFTGVFIRAGMQNI